MGKKKTQARQHMLARSDATGLSEAGIRFETHPIARVHLLSPMRATTYLGDDILPADKQARAVLAYLCLAAGKPVPHDGLASLIWDRAPEAAAQANLRRVVRELASEFGSFRTELISTTRETVGLNINSCWVDALSIMDLDPSRPSMSGDNLRALCRGRLLEEIDGVSSSFDRWLFAERTRVAERLQALLSEQVEQGPPAFRGLEHARAGVRAGATPNRSRLRVGVLPFAASGSENDENLTYSISTEIANALAQFRWFDVIAVAPLQRTTSTRFVDEHQLRHMELDYLIDWTASYQGKNIKVDIRLISLAGRARPVWNEHFELPLGDLDRLNEHIATRIVDQIDPTVLLIEREPKRWHHYDATGLVLLAIPLMSGMERRKYEQAGQLIGQALEIDPHNSMAAAWAARWHLFRAGQGWTRNIEKSFAAAQDYAIRAIKLDPSNAEAVGVYAHYCAFAQKNFDTALYYFDRSLRLNPSLAFTWALSGTAYCYIGKPDVALERLERCRDLAPLDPYLLLFETLYTIAYTFKGDYERAVIVGQRAVKALPDFVNGYKPLIASLGHLGRREEAKPYIDKLLSLEPDFTVERFGQVYPLKKASDRRRYMKGLLLAGVPAR